MVTDTGIDSGDREADLRARLDFLKAAGALKDTLRSARTVSGRIEDTAAHSWRLALWVFVFADRLPDIDRLRLLEICLVHDLGEALTGDVPAPAQSADSGRKALERDAICTLASMLPASRAAVLLARHEEYDSGGSEEARLARGLDKLETLLQHVEGRNPADFDYAFNLAYGSEHTGSTELLRRLRRLLDEATRARIDERDA